MWFITKKRIGRKVEKIKKLDDEKLLKKRDDLINDFIFISTFLTLWFIWQVEGELLKRGLTKKRKYPYQE